MATLYELTGDVMDLETRIDLMQDEDGPEYLASELLDKEEDLADKIDAYVSVFRSFQARAQAQRAEGKHLYDMAKANENSMDRLKEAVKYASHQLGRSKLQGNTRSITVSETSKLAVDITDANAIPDEFLEFYTECKIKKDAIAEHVMATGEIVAGTEVRKIVAVRFN